MEATMLRLFLQELRFRRNAMIIWGLGLCFFPVVYVGVYPSFADQMEGFQDIMDLAIYQAMGISMGSFEDYIASTVTNLVPVIVGIYAVINGTSTLAGEEDEGLLELIVTLPIQRWKILTVKAIALGIALFVILAIVAGAAGLTLMAILDQVDGTDVAPVDIQELVHAVNQIKRYRRFGPAMSQRYKVLEENLKSPAPTRLAIPSSSGLDFIDIEDILRIQAEGRYSRIYLRSGGRLLVTKNLGQFGKLLGDDNFFRSHHSHLVNTGHVRKYLHRDGGVIVLRDGSRVPLARARKKSFLKKIQSA